MSGAFDSLSIKEQIGFIKEDLQSDYWSRDSKVLAVSYGAYLLLQTLADLEPYPGSILMLSPVLGGVINSNEMRYYSPPRSEKIMNIVKDKVFPNPYRIECHVGDNDWQSPSDRVIGFSKSVGGKYNIVLDTGHDLGKEYVGSVLER